MESIFYKNIEFKIYKNEKYYSNFNLKKRLHQYVWEQEVGEIPKGYHVHHKDGNKLNNLIENLELLTMQEHLSKHSKDRDIEALRKNLKENARPKAIEWHKSEKGLEWHKEHYEKTKDKFHILREFICLECGEKFSSYQINSKFCSNNCKTKNRRKSGVDNVIKKCPVCFENFETNKYSKTITCSKSCGNRYKKIVKYSLSLQE